MSSEEWTGNSCGPLVSLWKHSSLGVVLRRAFYSADSKGEERKRERLIFELVIVTGSLQTHRGRPFHIVVLVIILLCFVILSRPLRGRRVSILLILQRSPILRSSSTGMTLLVTGHTQVLAAQRMSSLFAPVALHGTVQSWTYRRMITIFIEQMVDHFHGIMCNRMMPGRRVKALLLLQAIQVHLRVFREHQWEVRRLSGTRREHSRETRVRTETGREEGRGCAEHQKRIRGRIHGCSDTVRQR